MNLTNSDEFRKTCSVLEDEFVFNRFPSNGYVVNHIIALAVNVLITISTFFLNAVTVITLWRSRKLREKVSHFLIMVQSSIDLGPGLVSSILYDFLLGSELAESGNCWLHFVVSRTSLFLRLLSMTTLTAMNIDRYMSIVHPIVHRSKVTKNKLLKCIIAAALLTMVIFGISLVYGRALVIFAGAVTALFLTVTVYVYMRIFVAVMASNRINTSTHNNNTAITESISERKKKREFLKELRLAKSCSLVVMCFFACFLPAPVTAIVNPNGFQKVVWRVWTVTLAVLNASLNSLIFFWRNRMLRVEAVIILKSLYLRSS